MCGTQMLCTYDSRHTPLGTPPRSRFGNAVSACLREHSPSSNLCLRMDLPRKAVPVNTRRAPKARRSTWAQPHSRLFDSLDVTWWRACKHQRKKATRSEEHTSELQSPC